MGLTTSLLKFQPVKQTVGAALEQTKECHGTYSVRPALALQKVATDLHLLSERHELRWIVQLPLFKSPVDRKMTQALQDAKSLEQ